MPCSGCSSLHGVNLKFFLKKEVFDNDIQKRKLVDLEGVVETNLEQSYEKNHIVTKFIDIDRNNEETDIET